MVLSGEYLKGIFQLNTINNVMHTQCDDFHKGAFTLHRFADHIPRKKINKAFLILLSVLPA